MDGAIAKYVQVDGEYVGWAKRTQYIKIDFHREICLCYTWRGTPYIFPYWTNIPRIRPPWSSQYRKWTSLPHTNFSANTGNSHLPCKS
jgi:hypothetical protein